MRVECTGKVVSRTVRHADKGDIYSIVIEEPGTYPSRFEFTSTVATMFGDKEGPTGVGKTVTAKGFANGREQEIPRKDGSGTFKAYRVYFKLTALAPIETDPETVTSEESAQSDDFPF